MWIDDVKFDKNGLILAIAQDYESGEVLMTAYMNRESLVMTMETGRMTYWSRSRGELWIKGESSGNFQHVEDFRIDCDGDALLFKVKQKGGACHTGYRSCFYRCYRDGNWIEDGDKVFDPGKVYGK